MSAREGRQASPPAPRTGPDARVHGEDVRPLLGLSGGLLDLAADLSRWVRADLERCPPRTPREVSEVANRAADLLQLAHSMMLLDLKLRTLRRG
jgi:hypothetical protein